MHRIFGGHPGGVSLRKILTMSGIRQGNGTQAVPYGKFQFIVRDISYLTVGGVILRIVGLQKLTLLDFPGKVACTVFLGGCNFRCPFCHNGQLLGFDGAEVMSREDFFAFLQGRSGLLDGVCVTGGEPTLSAGLPDFLGKIKALGFAVKLDTNGSRPEVLRALLQKGLVDYVAMDVKNSPTAYAATVGCPAPLEALEESLRLLLQGDTPYELRTTVVRGLHTEASVLEMGQWLYGLCGGEKIPKIFLQPFVTRDTVPDQNLLPPESAQMSQYARLLGTFAQEVFIRG